MHKDSTQHLVAVDASILQLAPLIKILIQHHVIVNADLPDLQKGVLVVKDGMIMNVNVNALILELVPDLKSGILLHVIVSVQMQLQCLHAIIQRDGMHQLAHAYVTIQDQLAVQVVNNGTTTSVNVDVLDPDQLALEIQFSMISHAPADVQMIHQELAQEVQHGLTPHALVDAELSAQIVRVHRDSTVNFAPVNVQTKLKFQAVLLQNNGHTTLVHAVVQMLLREQPVQHHANGSIMNADVVVKTLKHVQPLNNGTLKHAVANAEMNHHLLSQLTRDGMSRHVQ